MIDFLDPVIVVPADDADTTGLYHVMTANRDHMYSLLERDLPFSKAMESRNRNRKAAAGLTFVWCPECGVAAPVRRLGFQWVLLHHDSPAGRCLATGGVVE